LLLRRRLQIAGVLRLESQALDALEDQPLVRLERRANLGCQIELGGHLLDDLWKKRQRDEARFEVGLEDRILQISALEFGVFLQERIERRDAVGVRRAQQYLREQLVGIQRD